MTSLVKRRIRDNLHGSIDLNSLEDKIISHPYFQRLRRVKQTAFLSFAFPGATHTRFEHSLGCMHLAGQAWKKILLNQERLKYKASKIPSDSNYPLEKLSPGEASLSSTFPFLEKIAKSEYAYQVLRLAALFHDVGHPPLSHTGEIFLPTQKEFLENNKNIPDYLRKQLEEKDQEKRVSHETYSILILDKILKDTYEDGVKGDSLLINPQDIASVVSLDIPPCKDSEIKELHLQSLLHELISGEVDVDRMDYLLRDSKECGVVYGVFDLDRILDSLAAYYKPKEKRFHLALKLSGLPAFEDFLRARQSMYLQVYLHKTSTAGDSMLQFLSEKVGKISFPHNHEDYCKLDDYNISFFLKKAVSDSKTLHAKEKERFLDFIENLFLDRKLWKNLYETSFTGSKVQSPKEITKIANKLDELGNHYKISYHKSTLTSKEAKKEIPLLLIHKDHKLRYTLSKLEEYSTLTEDRNTRHLVRIYGDSSITKESIREILK